MKVLISSWPRRLLFSLCMLLLCAALMLVWMLYMDHASLNSYDDEAIMRKLIIFPALVGVATLVLSSLFMLQSAQAAALTAQTAPNSAQPAPEAAPPFMAQVVGLQWMNPLQRRDYPTQWQILWTLGLVKPNKNDDMVKAEPDAFNSIRPVAGIAYGNKGQETFKGFHHKYIKKTLLAFRNRYFMQSNYFYTVAPDSRDDWREVSGLHVEYAIPAKKLDPVEAADYTRATFRKNFSIGEPFPKTVWSHDTLPDIRITQGGPNAGFTSLNAALDYLQTHPQESVWAMNWDAPSFPPEDEQMNENMAILILAGPEMKTGRRPLAWIGKAATARTQDQSSQAGTTRAVQAWKAAITTAAYNAGRSLADIQYTIHDADKGSAEASNRLAPLSRTLTEVLPEFDFSQQTFNTAGLLGDMGAGSALTNVVLAIGRANHLGGSVLVAGTTDADQPTAVVVVPPTALTPIDPDKNWFRARGENNAYLPWWGLRHEDVGRYTQGFSE